MNPVQRLRMVSNYPTPAHQAKAQGQKWKNSLANCRCISKSIGKRWTAFGGQYYLLHQTGNFKTIKLFETQDDKEIGLRNISNSNCQRTRLSWQAVSSCWLVHLPMQARTKWLPPITKGWKNFLPLQWWVQPQKQQKADCTGNQQCVVFKTSSNRNAAGIL